MCELCNKILNYEEKQEHFKKSSEAIIYKDEENYTYLVLQVVGNCYADEEEIGINYCPECGKKL
jgi:hypothetical protein